MLRIVVAGLVAALAACQDRGRCLASHSYEEDVVVQVASIPMGNGVTIPIYGIQRVTRTVCDRWEFPEGRPRR